MTNNDIDLTLIKERIQKWVKTDPVLFNLEKPIGDEKTQKLYLSDFLFGAPDDNQWSSVLAPFGGVTNSDNLISSDAFFGSVVNDALTSDYIFVNLKVYFVVQAASGEDTERQFDYIHQWLRARLKANVQLKNVIDDANDELYGTLVDGTELVATSRTGTSQIFYIQDNKSNRFIGCQIDFQLEIGAGA